MKKRSRLTKRRRKSRRSKTRRRRGGYDGKLTPAQVAEYNQRRQQQTKRPNTYISDAKKANMARRDHNRELKGWNKAAQGDGTRGMQDFVYLGGKKKKRKRKRKKRKTKKR